MTETTALVPVDDARALPLPVFSGAEMTRAIDAYGELCDALDRGLKDGFREIAGKMFRCKPFFRGACVAFNANVRCVDERREDDGTFADGRENFGWLVTYEATAPNGRTVTGDGACFAVEKAERFRCPHPHPSWEGKSLHFPHESCPDFDPDFRWRTLPLQASVHNVRSHAHTRAFNRAVSNLIGFGEVSAEEIDAPPDERPASRPQPRATTSAAPPRASTPPARPASPISDAQAKRLWAIATSAGWHEHEVRSYLQREHGSEHVHEITRDRYDAICSTLEGGVDGTRSAS